MTAVIKGCLVVTDVRAWDADVPIDGEKIIAVGPDLKEDRAIDAQGAYVMPRGIDPHTHLEMSFMIRPCVGAITPGADADIVVRDPKLPKTICPADQLSIIGDNVFEGFEVPAQPRYTISRSEVLWTYSKNTRPRAGMVCTSRDRPLLPPTAPCRSGRTRIRLVS